MSDVVDELLKKCKFDEKTSFWHNRESYHCKVTGIFIMKITKGLGVSYMSSCKLTEEESKELWYRIEKKPLIECRDDLLNWLGLGEKK